jgi:uncharacterized Tic20 family protein
MIQIFFFFFFFLDSLNFELTRVLLYTDPFCVVLISLVIVPVSITNILEWMIYFVVTFPGMCFSSAQFLAGL